MEQVDFAYGSFNINFKDGNDLWYLAIHPEMYPAREVIKPSGNHFIYLIHPTQGSVSFIFEQDENCRWFCEHRPAFFFNWFIDWIGRQIENYNR